MTPWSSTERTANDDGPWKPKSAKTMFVEPVTVTTAPDRSDWSATWTDLVTPCRVRSPVAVAVITTQSAGTAASWIGAVSLNVAVGNDEVAIPWWLSCPSRRESSLWRVVRSAVTWTSTSQPASASP